MFKDKLNDHLKMHERRGAEREFHVTSVARCLEIYFRYRLISGMCIRLVLGNEREQTVQQPDQNEQE